LEFNRSVADGGNTGINEPSVFVDGSTVYGNSEADLRKIRDYNNNGKMILIKDSTPDGAFGYPPVDANGDFIYGYSAEFGRNVFTDFFHILFVREHNRLCDELFAIHGSNWDDETYFQEARRWVIAFLQKITYYEYRKLIYNNMLSSLYCHLFIIFGLFTSRHSIGNSFT
jgi:hypothetical protein